MTAAEQWAYVPSRPLAAGESDAVLELRRTADGRLAVPVYSSLEELVRCCGEHQWWVAVDRDRVAALPAIAGADLLVWDVPLPDDGD